MSSTNISTLYSVLYVVQQKVAFSFALIYLVFGVTGCFLNILLFSRRQFRTISCCIYFFAASIAMFIQLSITSGTFIYSFYYKSPINSNVAYCKIWYYLTQTISYVFRWMLVAACLDRYALSSPNARLRRFANAYIAQRVVIAIVFIWIVVTIPFLFLYDIRFGICVILCGYTAALYVGIFIIIVVYLGPVSIMIICVFLIRQNLLIKRERRQQNETSQQYKMNDKEYLHRKRDQQALVMLFAQVIIYIITATPWVIFGIYNAISLNVPNKSADRLAIEQFMLLLTGLIILLFPTMTFYLYTLTSNMFRKELFIMFHSILRCECFVNHHRINPIGTNIQMETVNVK